MAGIVGIVGGGYLERLVSEDYGAAVGDEAKAAAISLMRSRQNIADMNLGNIQRFLRIVNQIIISAPTSLDGLTDRVYWYTIQGIGRTDEALARGSLSPIQRQHMLAWRCYMYANAGAAARQEYERTNQIVWRERAYEARYSSAKLSAQLSPRHSAHMYRLAGDDANTVSKARRTQNWRIKAIESYSMFINYCGSHPGEEPQELIAEVGKQVRFLRALNSYASSHAPVQRDPPPPESQRRRISSSQRWL
ncbi:hypothetical protein HYU15_03730 [Candidatus Woesearchaeota archaeon]|nr:hypothetical protein [Candidatus Woesearchaeota archaeon]